MKTFTTRQEYDASMHRTEELIAKATAAGGFEKLSKVEVDEFATLAAAAEKYENEVLKLYPFTGKSAVILQLEEEMFRRRMKQREMADLLGVSSSRFSEVLHGKVGMTMCMAKAIHSKLGIDGNLILESV